MAAMIKGIPVTLYKKTQTGVDAFNSPICTETPVTVNNVLVTPTNTTDIIGNLQLQGKRAEYELCIPKGDLHCWENCRVDFFGVSWKTVGFLQAWGPGVPLDWDKKIKVERYG